MSLTRTSKIKIILIIVICAIICLFFATLATHGCSSFSIYGTEGNMTETTNETYAAQDVKNLAIDFPAGELVIRQSENDTDSIQVVEKAQGANTKSSINCTLDNGTLNIHYDPNPFFWLFFNGIFGERRLLVVTIPKDVDHTFESFDVHVSSGNASVSNVRTNKASIDVSSGNAYFTDLSSQTSSIHLSSGMLTLSESALGMTDMSVASGNATIRAILQKLDSRVTSGRLTIDCENTAIDSIHSKVTSGQFSLSLPRESGFNAAISKTSGNFNCDFDCSVRGETYTYGNGATPIDIDITSGNAILKPLD